MNMFAKLNTPVARRRPRKARLRSESLERRNLLAVDFMMHDIGGTSNAYTDSMRTADFDGDGDLDFAFAQNNDGNAILSLYENFDGLGSFDEVQGIDRTPVTWIEVADMDGDGDTDIVAASYDAAQAENTPGLIVWYENTDGFFGEAQLIADDLFAPYFDVADIDGDGDVDVAAGSIGEVTWHENDGGNFSSHPVTSIEAGLFSFAVAVDDLDGDGDGDVIWSSYGNNKVGWSKNDGTGVFSDDQPLDNNASVVADLATLDIDGDGDRDIVVPDSSDLSIFTNTDGMGSFSKRLTDSGEHLVVEPADIDGDGDTDIVTDKNNTVVWFENTGNGSFARSQLIHDFSSQGLQAAFPSDLDGDGDVDILVNVAAYDANGGRIFWFENLSSTDRLVGDVNNDGRFDSSDLVAIFIVGEYEDDIPGNSTFEEGDWNGDGDFDTSDLVLAFTEAEYEPDAAAAKSAFAAALDDWFDRTKKAQHHREALGDPASPLSTMFNRRSRDRAMT